MENLLFAAPPVERIAKRKTSKKLVRTTHKKSFRYRITFLIKRIFKKRFLVLKNRKNNKKKSSYIFPTLVWFTDGSLKEYKIKGEVNFNNSTFHWTNDIQQVDIGKSVTIIGASAFDLCKSLERVTIPYSITNIEYRAFESCSSLTNVTIPDSVTRIGYWAFRRCTGLTDMVIGNGVVFISDVAFDGCDHLLDVHIDRSKSYVQTLKTGNWWGLTSGAIIHCTDGDITV